MISSYINKAPIALALERVFECYILCQQKFERPALDIGCTDGIFANSVLEHIVPIGEVLKEASRVLASDGRMISRNLSDRDTGGLFFFELRKKG